MEIKCQVESCLIGWSGKLRNHYIHRQRFSLLFGGTKVSLGNQL